MTEDVSLKLAQLKPLYAARKIHISALAAELGVTVRHARRVIGLEPKARTAYNRLGDTARELIRSLKEEYPSRNCQWLSEMAGDRLGYPVSDTSVWRILKAAGLLEAAGPARTPRTRFETEATGDLVQMDTTWGYWWKGQKVCLILILDDHSRYILHWKWAEHDTAAANMGLIKELVSRYGRPRILYTDNASFFKAIRHGKSRHQAHASEEYETEIGRACRELGILHLTHKPYSPQGKGKIERLFRFVQERFVSAVQDDPTIEWPDFLTLFESWVRWYNGSHVNRTTGCTPKERFDPTGFSPLPAEKSLDDVFCWNYTRKVDACNQFSFEGSAYTIPKERCMVAYRVTLHVTPGRFIRVEHQGTHVCTLPIRPK
jgi:putative transposase